MLLEEGGDGPEGVPAAHLLLGLGPGLRAAEVGGDDDARPAVGEEAEQRERGVEARGVGDRAVLVGRQVEVGANQDALRPDVLRRDVAAGIEQGLDEGLHAAGDAMSSAPASGGNSS